MTPKVKNILLFMIILFIIIPNYHEVFSLVQNNDIFFKNGSREEKIIALTFDDGPHPKETHEVLDVLNKYNVKGTFFVVGKHANWYSKPLIRAAKEGHEIGNHTFTHPDISNLSSEDIKREIKECEDTLVKLTGKKPTLFRPPYGSYSETKLGEIAKECGYKIILWTTIDAKDWKNPPSSQISDIIINKAKNGDIILLHDYATENTVKALDTIIPEMMKKGYKFVTVSELINK
ncbi:MAG: polysaccharide deacetylase family protein [Terrisporobacter othiniensis]|uniref:Peptidoglycan-N-acetylglucosamine deacetylase n=2 Tax=Terrisporobacter TaxID=1505652 RepID=A0ABZ3FF20_9FIRM|nr:polysaccharide deacetylase family protein [Terrisporobacter petrolearius]MBN9645355.1 polysaccharide deacetylase family protein [Terrisporobacter glycolicus]MDU4860725.1 polysaccharide deacetylase family protein [Terrisporobacter othiniensis]MDU6996620.1 polysaccharide deacetylase family protein [Terrisporobacter othiniensis]UPA31931.1 polysaccharide deacetylase family protein [Terrisporobacter glycolicus]SFJ28295.1 polysaccharide deacetylase family sporulation protein PdaB [Terrisporobacte